MIQIKERRKVKSTRSKLSRCQCVSSDACISHQQLKARLEVHLTGTTFLRAPLPILTQPCLNPTIPRNGHGPAGLGAVVTVGLSLGLRHRKRLHHHVGVP